MKDIVSHEVEILELTEKKNEFLLGVYYEGSPIMQRFVRTNCDQE